MSEMRGSDIWTDVTMSSACIQNANMLTHHHGVSTYDHHAMAITPQSTLPPWHVHSTIIKQETQENTDILSHDSGISGTAYTSGSDGFHSSSPGSSDHNSRDSEAITTYNTSPVNDVVQPQNYYSNSTPIQSRICDPAHNPGFNPLTPPSFEPMISPRSKQEHYALNHHNMLPYGIKNSPDRNETRNTTLTPPCEDIKSPRNQIPSPVSEGADSSDQFYMKTNSEDSLKNLQMVFERNGLIQGQHSPRDDEENRDYGDEDMKSDCEPEEGEDDQSLRTPRVNSHGKVKKFKCKQCQFIAVTKLDFWEHTKVHIKAEKLLMCPKCPFVTEYKHHLEYHLRNHFGSKPFKCTQCDYSCVNKSMLNSHLKSHSNIYQYRCADCAYATKYCHSLKLHLRKYSHKPAMVLNPDGSPNPLPIIDVYGTRRGPKQRVSGQKQEESQSSHLSTSPIMMNSQQHPLFPPQFMIPPPQSQIQLPFPFGPILNAFPRSLLFPPPNNNNLGEKMQEDDTEQHIDESPNSPPQMAHTEETQADEQKDDVEMAEDNKVEDGALDLSSRSEFVPVAKVSTTPTRNNRRKGRAFKLGEIALKLQHTNSDDEDTLTIVTNDEEEKKEKIVKEKEKSEETFNCQYCDIVFKDVVMYTMHMGYHGYKDPFTCNMCGEQSKDKVAFFLHIARTSHC